MVRARFAIKTSREMAKDRRITRLRDVCGASEWFRKWIHHLPRRLTVLWPEKRFQVAQSFIFRVVTFIISLASVSALTWWCTRWWTRGDDKCFAPLITQPRSNNNLMIHTNNSLKAFAVDTRLRSFNEIWDVLEALLSYEQRNSAMKFNLKASPKAIRTPGGG